MPVAASIVAWGVAVCAGLGALATYAGRPGAAGVSPARWPEASRVARLPGRPALVVGLHPGCPCSRATVEELDRLIVRTRGRASVHALVFRPRDVAAGWEQTDLSRRVAAIPGVTVVRDDDGVEAARFGVATSGHVVAYDAGGRLGFSGGITPARGHEGWNAGAARAAAVLAGDDAGPAATAPVFGCALREASAPAGGTS